MEAPHAFVAPQPLSKGFFVLGGGSHRGGRGSVHVRRTSAAVDAKREVHHLDASCSDMDGGESDSRLHHSEWPEESPQATKRKTLSSSQMPIDDDTNSDARGPAKRVRGSTWYAGARLRSSDDMHPPHSAAHDDAGDERTPKSPPKRQLRPRAERVTDDEDRQAKPTRRPQPRRKARKGPTTRDYDRLKTDHKKLHARYTLLKAKYSKLKTMHAVAISQNKELKRGSRQSGRRSGGAGREPGGASSGVDAEELQQRLVCTQLERFELQS